MIVKGIVETRTLSGDTNISFFTFSENEHAIILCLRVKLFIGFHVVKERNVDTENRDSKN